MSGIHIIYASTSGNTEYVVHVLERVLKDREVTHKRAELANESDITQGDVLVLASGTWNTGGREGQLNPHMHLLLNKRIADVDLAGKHVAIIALGDERYRYTARAQEHLRAFVESHGGTVFGAPLVIVNEPYGQENKIEQWAQKFSLQLSS